MYLFLIVILISLFIGLYAAWCEKKSNDYYKDYAGCTALGLLALFVGGLLAIIVSVSFGAAKSDQFVENCNYPHLYSVGDGTVESSHYYLFSGTSGEYFAYQYYTKSDQGEINHYTVYADHASVYEDLAPDQTPYLCVEHNTLPDLDNWTWNSPSDDHYVFHIPAGSVKNQYNLDNQNGSK